jgi:predicted nuclease of predicted toxin-antitoxin system
VKFLLDEDVSPDIAWTLKNRGHSIEISKDVLGKGKKDPEIWKYAQTSNRITITSNRDDFLALAGDSSHAGLIILKRRNTRTSECARLLKLLNSAGESGIIGNINFA